MVILGVDPGTARLGWGVIKLVNNEPSAIDYGCLTTSSQSSEPQRLTQLFNRFQTLIDHYSPQAISIEDLFFFKNQTTVIKVGQARGVILLASQLKKVNTFSYSPLQIKLAITGYGRADKHQIQLMTKSVLRLKTIPRPDDVADALAIALTHAFTYKMKNKLQ